MPEVTDSTPGVLLDVDGTLVESTYFHALAWWRALREAGQPAALFRIHRLIGMGADQLLTELLGAYRKEIDESYSRHFEGFKDEIARFPKVPELLDELSRRGARLVLATSAKPDQIGHLRELIGAQEAIFEVVASGDVEESKPSPDIFTTALEKGRLKASSSLVLGDSVWDVKAAKKAGLKCLGLLTGGFGAEELSGAGAIAIFEDPEDLLDRLDDSPLGQLLARYRPPERQSI